jgi:hypothetical protein
MIASVNNPKAERLNYLRNNGIQNALEMVLKLADPDCDEVSIAPTATAEAREAERKFRKELAPFLNTWVIDTLANVLRQTDLETYAHVYAPRTADLLDRLDELDAERQKRV